MSLLSTPIRGVKSQSNGGYANAMLGDTLFSRKSLVLRGEP